MHHAMINVIQCFVLLLFLIYGRETFCMKPCSYYQYHALKVSNSTYSPIIKWLTFMRLLKTLMMENMGLLDSLLDFPILS